MLEEFETRGQDELSREVLELRRQVETLTTSLETLSVNFAAHQHSSIDGSEKLYNESIILKPGNYVQGMLSGGDGKELEVKSGEITVYQSYHSVAGEGGVADTLITISSTNQVDGQLLLLNAEGVDVTITSDGNIRTNGPMILVADSDMILLMSDGNNWNEVSRSFNGSGVHGFMSMGNEDELVISLGVITPTSGFHRVDTEGDIATDDLDTILEPASGIKDGTLLIIRPSSGTRTVVAKHNTGNLRLAGDFTMNDNEDTLTLIWNGTDWLEVSRSDNS